MAHSGTNVRFQSTKGTLFLKLLMKHFRTITLILLTGIVAATAGFMLGRYDMQKEQEKLLMKPPTHRFADKNASYTDIDTSSWQEYCNTDFNYCIKYPAQTWEVSVEDGGAFGGIDIKDASSNIRGVGIVVYYESYSKTHNYIIDNPPPYRWCFRICGAAVRETNDAERTENNTENYTI